MEKLSQNASIDEIIIAINSLIEIKNKETKERIKELESRIMQHEVDKNFMNKLGEIGFGGYGDFRHY